MPFLWPPRNNFMTIYNLIQLTKYSRGSSASLIINIVTFFNPWSYLITTGSWIWWLWHGESPRDQFWDLFCSISICCLWAKWYRTTTVIIRSYADIIHRFSCLSQQDDYRQIVSLCQFSSRAKQRLLCLATKRRELALATSWLSGSKKTKSKILAF